MVSNHLSASSAVRPIWPAVIIAFSVSVLFISPRAFAQLKDVAGSKDHATIKHYEGSVILGYDFKKFDEYVVLLGPVKVAALPRHLADEKSKSRGAGHADSVCRPGGSLAARGATYTTSRN